MTKGKLLTPMRSDKACLHMKYIFMDVNISFSDSRKQAKINSWISWLVYMLYRSNSEWPEIDIEAIEQKLLLILHDAQILSKIQRSLVACGNTHRNP